METTIQNTGKKALKIAGAACLAAGVVAVSALVASGAATGAVRRPRKTLRNLKPRQKKMPERIIIQEKEHKEKKWRIRTWKNQSW